MPEVVAEIVKSLAAVALKCAEESFANCFQRFRDSFPKIANPIPPLIPAAKFIPAIEDALDSIEESSNTTIDLIGDGCPQFSGLLEVAEDRSEDRGPSRAKGLGCCVDQLRESLDLSRCVVCSCSKTHDFVGLLLGVTSVQELLTRQVTSVLRQSLDHDL